MVAIDREAQRRQQLITSAGYRTRDRFVAETGIAMPLLIALITDGMDAVQGNVEELLLSLVAKARSLVIRIMVSMQTPSGKDVGLRVNLSTVLAGTLTDGLQDMRPRSAYVIRGRCATARPCCHHLPCVQACLWYVMVASNNSCKHPTWMKPALTEWLPNCPPPRTGATQTQRSHTDEQADSAAGIAAWHDNRGGSSIRALVTHGVAEAPRTAVVESPPPRRWKIDINALQPTQEEVQYVGRALEIYRRCNNKQQAIEGVFDCHKGSSAKWQRAVRLFDLANAGASAEREHTLSAT